MVPDEMAQSLVRLLSEGSGQGDARADAQLRAQAVHSHLRLLSRPNLPDTLLKVPSRRDRTEMRMHGAAQGMWWMVMRQVHAHAAKHPSLGLSAVILAV